MQDIKWQEIKEICAQRRRHRAKCVFSRDLWKLGLMLDGVLRCAEPQTFVAALPLKMRVAHGVETLLHGGGGSLQCSLATGPPPHVLPPSRQPNTAPPPPLHYSTTPSL